MAEIFSISNFWVGRADLQNIGWSITKLLNSMRVRETDFHTKFQTNRTKIAKLSHFQYFWLVGWLGWSACTDFEKKFRPEAYYLGILLCKKSSL